MLGELLEVQEVEVLLLGLLGTNATREERQLLSFSAPRGIVAAAVTTIFALEFLSAAERTMEEAVQASGDDAEALTQRAANLCQLAGQATELVPLVFLVIVFTVALYGLGVGRLAERLGLGTTGSMEVRRTAYPSLPWSPASRR